MRLKYEWRAVFEDGEVLDEWDPEDEKARSIRLLFQKQLRQFQLIERDTGEAKVTVHIRPGMKIIHRRRWRHKLNLRTGDQSRVPCWIVGWHENRRSYVDPNGINVQMIAFVFDDGRVELLDRWRDDNVLYHPVKLLPEELL